MSPDNSGVKAEFDRAAKTYDSVRRLTIPCFDDFYGTVARMIPFGRDDAFDVLDLGAGTGLLSALLHERFPKARLTLVDISDEMLARARERFVGAPRSSGLPSRTTRSSRCPASSMRSSPRSRSTTLTIQARRRSSATSTTR